MSHNSATNDRGGYNNPPINTFEDEEDECKKICVTMDIIIGVIMIDTITPLNIYRFIRCNYKSRATGL